ncbi:transglutaminase-like domain-containing protein [Formosa sp. 3Alg 14/1]|uniref:transglutaminase-like domain-containing protein n=1 Tax=Formosa sp. 3Alg 14/1 TaxID=3382190 RepID=UPI0039BE5107
MFNYTIKYTAENIYENPVFEAFWQFLIIPQNNETQDLVSSKFSASLDCPIEKSINGYDFETVKIHYKKPFETMRFEAVFKMKKAKVKAVKVDPSSKVEDDYKTISTLGFKVDFEASLINTTLTRLPKEHLNIFEFDTSKHILDNVIQLNFWIYNHLIFNKEIAEQDINLKDVLDKKQAGSQDFVHLFLAIIRQNNVPARYVSGYLRQDNDFFNDSQIHAWAEVYVPKLGWVGFDPINNVLVNHNHVKIAHGQDYNDCEPSKQFLFSLGGKKIKHTVEVTYEQ